MPRLSLLNSPLLLGFDEIERFLNHAAKGGADGYPPYNIERIVADEDVEEGEGEDERLRITLAVAGFKREQLSVLLEDNKLTIRGEQSESEDHGDYLHRGIAARQFQRTFVLADGLEVNGAELRDGLLLIDLARPQPRRLVRQVKIHQAD